MIERDYKKEYTQDKDKYARLQIKIDKDLTAIFRRVAKEKNIIIADVMRQVMFDILRENSDILTEEEKQFLENY